MENRSVCPGCKKRKVQRHHSSKWCKPCALDRRKKPRGNLTKSQEQIVRKNAGKIPKEKIAELAETSSSSVMRWARDNGISLDSHSYPKEKMKEMIMFYEKHGSLATKKRFSEKMFKCYSANPKRHHHIYKPKPRQIRWTKKELLELVKMAGIITPESQAKYFNRPRANAGSIKSAWTKTMKVKSPGDIHGLRRRAALQICDVDKIKPIETKGWWLSRKGSFQKGKTWHSRRIYLWIDIAKNLHSGLPEFISEGVYALSDFQYKLFGKYPRRSIQRMIHDRE